ncbi:hypothetical protein [Xylella fastidiosa]|uniref:hypothetical protein n=1 Tax=Xylella fastidiosa TaxID=2371 RepID=UPI0007338B86|nr:hypothetical protein [Xylella fastidiosa]TNW23082.1 hypothetical protein EIP73_09540 [Xylella fastidiosa subsp. pauca]
MLLRLNPLVVCLHDVVVIFVGGLLPIFWKVLQWRCGDRFASRSGWMRQCCVDHWFERIA